jgi:hypothetical protein
MIRDIIYSKLQLNLINRATEEICMIKTVLERRYSQFKKV